MADLSFDNLFQEARGIIYPGKLRLRENDFLFKNEQTGKVDHFPRNDIVSAQWISRAAGLGLRIVLKNETMHRYDGFGEIEADTVKKFFKKYYDVDITKREMSYRGFNWGDAEVVGDVFELSVKNSLAFEIPIGNISNASVNKNELLFEFHMNDDADICLSEMRLYTPGTESDREGSAPTIYAKVMERADVVQVTGDFLVQFKEMQCLQPRGRYDIKLYPSFVHLHGKSFDFKIPRGTITRLMMLPHPDNRQIFFVVQLDPPIKHGQTRYHFVIILFDKDEHSDIDLSATDEWLQEHYEGKLARNVAGPTHEVVARIFKVMFEQKVTVPGSFSAKTGGSAVSCSYKASVGLLYPLERGFTFVPRPPVSIRFDEVIAVQFSRGTGAQRSFDFEVETRNGLTHTFTSIDRNEYHQLYDFVRSKKLRVKNIQESGTKASEVGDAWSSSDESHDAYMETVKTEGRERLMEVDDDDDDEDDEDFQPPPESDASELAEEYDSNVQTTTGESSDEDSDGDSGSHASHSDVGATHPPVKKDAPIKKSSTAKTIEKAKRTQTSSKKTKKVKDPNAHTRPPTAFMLWLNEHRDEISKSLGGASSVTEVGRAAGERWRNLDADTKTEYQARVAELKGKYDAAMRVYQARIASGELQPPPAKVTKKASKTPSKSPSKATGAGSTFKSEEYVEASESDLDTDMSDEEFSV